MSTFGEADPEMQSKSRSRKNKKTLVFLICAEKGDEKLGLLLIEWVKNGR